MKKVILAVLKGGVYVFVFVILILSTAAYPVHAQSSCNGGKGCDAGLICSAMGCVAPTTPTPPGAPGTPGGGSVSPNQLEYVPLEPLASSEGITHGSSDLSGYISAIFTVAISLGALFAVFMFAVGGIQYMISDVVDMKGKARDRMSAAIWGLLLLISSYLILKTLDPCLLNFNLQSLYQDAQNAGGQSGTAVIPQRNCTAQ